MPGEAPPCFECLERRIHADLSPDLEFRHGVSSSALPFGAHAVLQIEVTREAESTMSEEVSAEFMLIRVVDHESSDCSSVEDGAGNSTHAYNDMSPPESGRCLSENDAQVLDNFIPSVLEIGSLHPLKCNREGSVSANIEKATISSHENFSCLSIIASLTPVTYVNRDFYSAIKGLLSKYLFGLTEDCMISSLNLFIGRNKAGECSENFLQLVGFPSFSQGSIPGSVRHPSISPILGVLQTSGGNYLFQPTAPYTLENILHYSPYALKSDWDIRFLAYQILSALAYMHGLGVPHGNICPSSIMLTNPCWSWLSLGDMHLMRAKLSLKEPATSSSSICLCMEHCPCQAMYADSKLSDSVGWHSEFKQWWMGELSNYEYLLILNRLAGRRWGDHTFHTVMPWVIDFSVKPDEASDTGWRDLKKSKWRLAKGDEQLDFTYSTSEVPHHISDECLSELAVCSYKARRLPLKTLCSAVRSVYEPNEYPSNMQRLYQWTPDECIPEFYSDPRIFSSLHAGMSDLAVPSWAASPEEFISLHREALEGERVSRNIHHWIDITFGYQLSGQASILAKNVMLPLSDPSMPRSTGRRQIFTRPHPMRRSVITRSHHYSHKEACISHQVQGNKSEIDSNLNLDATDPLHFGYQDRFLPEIGYMEALEEATYFCEHARHLNPIYCSENIDENISSMKLSQNENSKVDITDNPSSGTVTSFDLSGLLESFEADDDAFMGFQELFQWRQKSSSSGSSSEVLANDVFSFGCILAELYLNRPLFDPVSLAAYKESGVIPELLHELPPQVEVLVEASVQRDWRRRPSAMCFLESQYFPPTVRSTYLFVAPLQLLAKTGDRLQYAAKLASKGALRAMGTFAAEMCATYCLPLIMSPLSDTETESALCLLQDFLKCLTSHAVEALILPTIQKILQASEYSHLKVSILQDSFVRELWNRLGKHRYLEKMHPLVISNLCNSPNKITASAASVVLIGSSEELGVPVTVHRTVLPLIQSFGKGLSTDGIDALVRIGGLLGENFVVRQLLPLLRSVLLSCIDVSLLNKPEPLHSWNSLTMLDSFATLDGVMAVLPIEVVMKELIQDQVFLHVKVLMQSHLDLPIIQVAATTLLALCQRIGPELTALHVIPQLKDLFDELAFSQAATTANSSRGKNSKASQSKSDEGACIESRMDLVLLLYPSFASLIGIEKLRQCCSTWFLLEQILQRAYKWKWESTGETARSIGEIVKSQRYSFGKMSPSEYNPAKLLLNGVGWSTPQSQGIKGGMNLVNPKQADELQRAAFVKDELNPNLGNHEPWFWFPSPAFSWDGPDFLGRIGNQKDELPWKIKASILYSKRAHPGTLRSLAVCHDESVVYTGGVGPGLKGCVQKWELPRMICTSSYYGHDEVVNAICILSMSGRVASCDGTIHIWNGLTGKLIAAFAEPSTNFPHFGKVNTDQTNMLTPGILSGGILSNAISGSFYTCMHHLDFGDKLVAGMGNGSIRFIDLVQDRKLHLWKSDTAEISFLSLVSAICSCGSEKLQVERAVTSPSWIAAGLSSGLCRVLDARSGNIVAHWRAHDGYITKLAAPEDHLLVSSSLDKTLKVWDLRRNPANQSNLYRGHLDGISGFSVWGQDVISVSKHKIGLTSLSKSIGEGGERRLLPQNLYSADRGTRNLSVLSAISILPFSRLFLLGAEDGFLKICC